MKEVFKIKFSNLIGAFIALIGLVWISSCTRPDTNPQLEITVLNLQGEAVPMVKVGLFDEQDEWSMLENPVHVWRETDQRGKVLFVNLQVLAYYIYADGDSLSNIGHEIKLDEALKINEIRKLTVIVE